MKRKTLRVLIALVLVLSFGLVAAVPAAAANPTTIPSSTMVFYSQISPVTYDEETGIYEGVIPMISQYPEEMIYGGDGILGYDLYARNGAKAWFGDNPGTGPEWTSLTIADHDAMPAYDPDTPDWYQYSLHLYGDNGVQKWAVRNHPGATVDNPWFVTGIEGWPKPPKGVPMSGTIDWSTSYARETDIGAYLPESGGIPEIPGGAAANHGGPACWDMDWSWGSEVVPLQFAGFNVVMTQLKPNFYAVSMTPGPPAPQMDKDWYKIDDTVYVTVKDAAANDPLTTDQVVVTAVSDTDTVGCTVTLGETGTDTGVFEGSFLLKGLPVPPEPGEPGELVVQDDDLITVTYLGADDTARVDDTIPEITIDAVISPTNVTTQAIHGTFLEANPDKITLLVKGSPVVINTGVGTWATVADAPLQEGDNPIVATITDKIGNSAIAEATIYLDTTPPSGSIDIIPDFINAANVLNVQVIIGSNEYAHYDYSIDGVADDGWMEAGEISLQLDLFPVPEGDVTATVSFTDELGNPSDYFFDYAWKDTEVPSPPEIGLTDPINAGNQYTVDLMGTGEAGAWLVYSITDEIDGEVTGEGPVLGDDSIEIPGIDVSSLVDGTLTASVTQTDEAGNTSDPCTVKATKDTGLPAVAIDSEALDPTNTSPIGLTARFTEPVQDFELADISVENGTAANLQDLGGGLYTFDVTPADDGVVTVDIAAGVAQDAVGNPNEAAEQFSITYDTTTPEVTVISPNGGENWLGGSIQDITWTAEDAGPGGLLITIEYSLNAGNNWEPIIAGIENSGEYSWVVPNLGSTYCKVRVTAVDAAGNIGSDISNFIFTLSSDVNAPVVTVNSPNGGEVWQALSDQTITWTATDDKTPPGDLVVELSYSINGGTNWLPIEFSGSNTGSYSWAVPENDSGQCLVLIEVGDTSGNIGRDVSDRVFTITIPEVAPEPTYDIKLKTGWNLVSLMLIPTSSNITDVLEGIDVVSVWAYDASTGEWSFYSPDTPGDLEKMVDGKGYWINMSVPATLTIEGEEMPDPAIVPPAYSVVEGWNLIGFKSTTPETAHDYLLGIDGKYTLIYRYDSLDLSYFIVGPGESLIPGYGYWISVTEPGTIFP